MSYLLDKKLKRKKLSQGALFIIVFIILFYFRMGIWNKLSSFTQTVFHPAFVLVNKINGGFLDIGTFFSSKNSLIKENEALNLQHIQDEATILNYNALLDENANLKEILGRKKEKVNMVLTAILAKPNQSPYDTLVVDAGTREGIKGGDTVFAFGNVPIGRIDTVYDNSSKVVLFSNSGEKTSVSIGKGAFMEAVRRGGGNFEMVLPRGFVFVKGDQVFLPGLTPYVLGIVQTIISDPRDAFQKALLVSPVNIQELKFVEVEI